MINQERAAAMARLNITWRACKRDGLGDRYEGVAHAFGVNHDGSALCGVFPHERDETVSWRGWPNNCARCTGRALGAIEMEAA